MRRIDARRDTVNFKALFPSEFELLTKNHYGALWPAPIRSRDKRPLMNLIVVLQMNKYKYELGMVFF